MAIKVFLHICAMNDCITRLNKIIAGLLLSGLYGDAEQIYSYICGNIEIINQVEVLLNRSGSKFKIIKIVPEDNTYERLTLTDIHNHVSREDKILYLHTKGISKPGNQNVDDWVFKFHYFLIGKYKDCIEKLESFDTVSTNFWSSCCNHFSGNMWWVNGDYFLNLPHEIGNDYFAPELAFLFLNNPKYYSLHDSNIDHYSCEYPPVKYI